MPEDARAPLLHELVTRDFVGLERELTRLAIDPAAAEALLRIPQVRGGPEVLSQPGAEELAGLHALLPAGGRPSA